jgi:hypothetical protein
LINPMKANMLPGPERQLVFSCTVSHTPPWVGVAVGSAVMEGVGVYGSLVGMATVAEGSTTGGTAAV